MRGGAEVFLRDFLSDVAIETFKNNRFKFFWKML